MALQQNTDHIQTTHIGSLPRPHNLLDLLKAKYSGQPYDEGKLNSVLTQSVADCVRKQVECGIEIVTDGEYSKPDFFTYIRERFDGFESRLNQKLKIFQKEVVTFPEYYAQYFNSFAGIARGSKLSGAGNPDIGQVGQRSIMNYAI
jgi:5-methyltetrahydropteroyltriglutamate--homocysteine methyltransferase